jgi:hypothetical protein
LSDDLYESISPTRVKLGPDLSWKEFCEHAELAGLSPKEFTKHLWEIRKARRERGE